MLYATDTPDQRVLQRRGNAGLDSEAALMQACVARLDQTAGSRPAVLKGYRILFVLPGFTLSGSERQAILLAQYLRAIGAVVDVVAFGEVADCRSPRVAMHCNELGLRWHSFPLFGSHGGKARQLVDMLRFIRFLREIRPHVLLPYTLGPNVICGLAKPFSGARCSVWNQRDEGRGTIKTAIVRVAAASTSAFVANSAEGLQYLHQQLGVVRSNTYLVSNGVALPAARASRDAWRTELGLGDDSFSACMVAKLAREYKDHATLIRAWRRVVDSFAPSRKTPYLILAGALQNATDELRALTNELRLNEHVLFLGVVDDISGLLSAVDMGVFSSTKEGVPNGVLECMAAGLAVCGTDYAGIREAVGKANTQYLARAHDAHMLADCILQLAENANLRSELGKANCQRIDGHFSVERMGERMTHIIMSALPTPRRRFMRQRPA